MAVVENAMASFLPKLVAELPNLLTLLSALLNAFTPVNSAAISILTDGSTAISYAPQPC